jgi:hypothetical protein
MAGRVTGRYAIPFENLGIALKASKAIEIHRMLEQKKKPAGRLAFIKYYEESSVTGFLI